MVHVPSPLLSPFHIFPVLMGEGPAFLLYFSRVTKITGKKYLPPPTSNTTIQLFVYDSHHNTSCYLGILTTLLFFPNWEKPLVPPPILSRPLPSPFSYNPSTPPPNSPSSCPSLLLQQQQQRKGSLLNKSKNRPGSYSAPENMMT